MITVIHIYSVLYLTDFPFVKVVEFAEYGNLEESSDHHTVERLCKFTIQAATALEHVETKDVVHAGVVDYNCLVVEDYQVSTEGELFVDLLRCVSY